MRCWRSSHRSESASRSPTGCARSTMPRITPRQRRSSMRCRFGIHVPGGAAGEEQLWRDAWGARSPQCLRPRALKPPPRSLFVIHRTRRRAKSKSADVKVFASADRDGGAGSKARKERRDSGSSTGSLSDRGRLGRRGSVGDQAVAHAINSSRSSFAGGSRRWSFDSQVGAAFGGRGEDRLRGSDRYLAGESSHLPFTSSREM